jgi:hypothetical protein
VLTWTAVRRYLEAMEVLELPLLEETGEYFIVSAASSLTSLEVPSLVAANGVIAGRSVSVDGPWDVLTAISFPMLSEVVGSVYIRPNAGTTPLDLNLASYNGENICVRASNIALGSNLNCNFPLGKDAPVEARLPPAARAEV